MAPERYDVVARAPDYTLDGVGNVVVAAGRVERVTITLKRALTIEGTVVDADKAPVAGAYVSCLAIPTFRSYELVETDASGRFTLTGLAAGTYMILGGRDDRGEGMTPNVKAGDRAARIQLGGAGAIRGRVLEADGKPAQKFSVRPYTGDWFRYNYSRQFAFADPEGRFVLPIAPGAYSLDVRSESGSFTTSKAVTVVKGENAETEIKLPAAGVVTGVVTDPDGAHLSGAEVFVKRGGFPPEPVREQYARADGDGRFTVKGLALEQVKLHVRHAGFATTEFATTAAPADQAKEVTIRMGRGARVLGRVQTKDGRPVEGTQLNLAQGFDFFSATAFTDGTCCSCSRRGAGKVPGVDGSLRERASGQRREGQRARRGRRGLDFQAQDDPTGTGSVTGKVSVAGKPVAKAIVNAVDDLAALSSDRDSRRRDLHARGPAPGPGPGLGADPRRPDGQRDRDGRGRRRRGRGEVRVRQRRDPRDARGRRREDARDRRLGRRREGREARRRQRLGGRQGAGQLGRARRRRRVGARPRDVPAPHRRVRLRGEGHRPVPGGGRRDPRPRHRAPRRRRRRDGQGHQLERGAARGHRRLRAQRARRERVPLQHREHRLQPGGTSSGASSSARTACASRARGFAPVEQDVAVTAQGAVADAVMVSGGSLVARVEDERGQPVADARIVLFDGTGKRLERTLSIVNLFEADATRTKASGTATIPDLAPGRYRATVEKDGAVAVGDPIAFTVEAGGRADVTLKPALTAGQTPAAAAGRGPRGTRASATRRHAIPASTRS
jgi:hypothetical protein